ncbi:MAG: hypothetical protein MSA09_05590 [Lachnospiraceae bacterium]|nr:hypothetical protein [Lachnospiraceae bacterium]
MYKDVKKKLLAVALCICMVIGAVEVVPRVKAAATADGNGYYPITVGYKTATGSEQVRVKLATATSLGFKNAPYEPMIADVINSENVSIKGSFQSKMAVVNNGDNVNVGSFYCKLVPTSDSKYATIDTEENFIEFHITPVKIADLIIDTGSTDNLVLKYSDSGVKPTFVSVEAKLDDSVGTRIPLDVTQYDASDIRDVGRNLSSTVRIKDNKNFSNESDITKEVKCDVAYDLGDSRFMKLNESTLAYTGNDLSDAVTMSLFDAAGNTVMSNASKATEELTVYFNGSIDQSVIDATTYTIDVVPAGGEEKAVLIGNKLYTGKFSTQFTVGLKTPESMIVNAYDEDAKTMKQLSSDTSSYMYRISLSKADENGNVYPSNLQVIVDNTELTPEQYDIRCVNSVGVEEEPTKAGRYTLYITPKASTNYTGQAVVVYYVYSNLMIEKIRLENATANADKLDYIGEGRKVVELVVRDSSGNLLTKDTDYVIEYWYKDEEWVKADDYDVDEMTTVGDKRIVVKGIKSYEGESVTWDYQISRVHLTDSAEAGNFALNLVDGTSFDYTGKEIKPKYEFTYYNSPIAEEYYDTYWDNNIEAGTATFTVRAKATGPFVGSLAVNFTIRALQLDRAECIGDGISAEASEYSYTGNALAPKLKIGEYLLTEGTDYSVVSYVNRDTGEELTEAPSALGRYSMSITTGTNRNLKGSKEIMYAIIERDISNDAGASFYLNGGTTVEWNGGTTEPEVICGSMTMEKDTDYTVRYENNTAPTTDTVSACAIITGKNNFKNEKRIYFEITKRKISNPNVVITPKVTGAVPPYNVTLAVKDEGTAVEKKTLVDGTDYQITNVVYETADDYTGLRKDSLNSLERAGVYTITLEGQKNYGDTVDVTVACGTNLANAEIKLGVGTFTYNGKEQYPSITVKSADGNKSTFTQGDDKNNSDFYPVFTRNASDDARVPDGYENIYAGWVYVKAVGNTKNGYYGSTGTANYEIGQLDISYSKSLYKVDLTEDPDNLGTDDDGRAHFGFTNRSIYPQEVVKQFKKDGVDYIAVSAPAILTKNVDYTVSYGAFGDDTCISKGTHWVYVDGMGNFTGRIGSSFVIDSIGINSKDITADFENVDTYAEGVPTLILTLNGSLKLQEGVDYQVNITREKSAGATWKDTYVYKITGMGNFAGSSREERQKVTQTVLNRAADFKNPKEREVYIAEANWDYNELLLPSDQPLLPTPSGFTITYLRTDGTTYNLSSGEDFEVTSFVPTMKPGTGSTMVVQGIGGFSGEVTFDVNLYTDINKAEFLRDEETGDYASVLSPGGSVPIGELSKAISDNRLSELVTFKNIWPDETGGVIDTSCYTVSVPNGYTPQIGKVTLTIAGNRDKYYAGSRTITVSVTGQLDEETTTVEIGDNNLVPWQGQIVTPGAVKVQVVVGTERLTGGYIDVGQQIPDDWDYTVTFTNNSGIGLATATITGVNTYSGTVTQTFKITCSMSDLTIQMQDKDGKWGLYDGGSPEYLYRIDTEKNKPAIKLYYSMKDGELREVAKSYYSIAYSGYESAGNANIVIGESETDTYQGILLGTNRVVNYVLTEIPLDTVTIEISNPNPTFTGNEMTATDIGLKLTYGSYELTGLDYTLTFKDAVNTDDVDGKAARVVIFGRGNFDGTVEKEFHIAPLPIGSTDDINAYAKNLIYTGNEVAPEITINQVTGNIRTLKEGIDYKIIKYLDASKTMQSETPFSAIGTYYVRVEGLGNYRSVNPYRDIEYMIEQRDMKDGVEVTFVNSEDYTVINGVPQCTYNGKEQQPGIQVTYNNKTLNGPDDKNPEYSVKYTDNVNVGKATVTVTGLNSFSGTKTVNFSIQPKDITGEDMVYRDSEGNAFKDEQVFEWTKSAVRPEIIIHDMSIDTDLEQSETETGDYQVKYEDDNDDDSTQVNAGEVTMTVKGQGNYTGTKTYTYYIGEDISKSYTLINGKNTVSTVYNGLVQAPEEKDITVVWGASSDLTDENNEKRYQIAYYKNDFSKGSQVSPSAIVDAATYYIAVVGVPSKGTYAKSSVENSCAYTILPRSIAPSYILVSGYEGTYYYTGQPIRPTGITVEDTDLPVAGNTSQKRTVQLRSGVDYVLDYANETQAGKASIIVKGTGNYTGERAAYFTIISSNAGGNNTWDGSSEGTGSISNGTTTIAASDIHLGYDNSTYECMMYNGYERIPTVSINGMVANEFIVTASNNVRPGIATLTITGRGNNFTGTIIKNYVIKADLSSYGTIATIADQVYTGYQITPHVTLTCGGNVLNEGIDYTVSYLNNTTVGKATVMATATSDSYYIGTATGSFNISNTAGGMEITGYGSAYTYTGYPITPDVVVTMNGRMLTRGTDYIVTYSNNTNVGTASMTVTGIGSFSGTKTITYAIEAKNIENCLTTAVENYQYTGSTYTPGVTVTDSSTGKTLVAGTDYTITYSNNTNPGTASITVTALSKNYTGSKVIPFKITSAAVSGLRTSKIKNSSIKLAWSSQDYADGYQICNTNNRVVATTTKNSYTVKGLNSCTTYKFKVRSYVENTDGTISYGDFSTAVSAKTLLNTPKLTVKSTSKGKVTLTWTKVSKATGYEIFYSTKKDGIYTRLKTISKSSTRKYVDSGLASGEKYYYTIRAYRTANGVKTYSNYNTIKAVRVK